MVSRNVISMALVFVFAGCGGSEEEAGGSAGAAGSAGDAGGAGGEAGAGGATGGSAGQAGMAGTAGTAGTGGEPDGGAGAGGASQLHSYRCDPVGTSPTDGIFSLAAFDGVMHVGLFGYGHEAESMLFAYPPWGRVEPGLRNVAESVCAMGEYDGRLYANTESDGHIYRSADGVNWEMVYSGAPGQIGCGLCVFGGDLYAVNYDYAAHDHGRVLRSSNGSVWEVVYDSGAQDLYLRHLVVHDGVLYALGTMEGAGEGKWLSSANGTDWTLADTPTRFFRALSHSGELYLSSTTSRSNGPAGIWRYAGGGFELVHPVSDPYVTDLAAWDGAVWAGTSDGWKEATGDSSLRMSRDGESWESVCTFPEAAVWAVEPLEEHLYVGTWEYGSHGRLYEVSIEEQGAGGAGGSGGGVDCSSIPAANSSWEVCESGADFCAGVFDDGAGCVAYCAAAGLSCFARYGGEPGCTKEPDNLLSCDDDSGHQSDWCECR